jgi:hypothetical protein
MDMLARINNPQADRTKAIDRYCRVKIPLILVIVSIAIFAHPRS